MVKITVSIPEELYKKIKKHSEYNWDGIIIKAFEKVLEKSEIQEELFSAISSKNKKQLEKYE
jgi:hypothetical protein